MSTKSWKSYEDVTRQLLKDVREHLGLEKIEGKQKVKGQITGTEWEIEAVAYEVGTGKMVLVECKKRSTAKIPQETIGGFAYRIQDTGAEGGILVTTLGLQEEAQKVARAAKITEVRLDPNATSESYIAQIANNFFLKFTDRVTVTDYVQIKIEDAKK